MLQTLKDWIRWKYVLPLFLFLAALLIFCLLFLDPLAKRALISVGERIAGAKVEVDSVRFSFRKTFVTIRGMRVADRDDPWKNLFEFENADFNYLLEPLLSKKLVVQDMSVGGLRWGTPRKTSGAIKKRGGPGIFEKLAKSVDLPDVDLKDFKEKDWKKFAKPEDLSSLKMIEEGKKKAESLKETWKDKIKALDAAAAAAKVRSSVEAARNLKVEGPADWPKAKQVLEDLKASADLLSAKLREAQALKAAMEKDFGQARGALAAAEEAKARDVREILGKLKLRDLSPRGLARSVFGPLWFSRLDSALFWVKQARKTMPSKGDIETLKKEPKPRREGLTLSFPGMKAWPRLLIEKISASGSTGKTAGETSAVDFSGEVRGVASDPAIYGKPMTLDFKGNRGALALSLKGLLDHTGETSKDQFTASGRGLELSGHKLNLPAYLPSLVEKGIASGDFKFSMAGPAISASLAAKAENLKLGGLGQAKTDIERAIQSALSKVTRLNLAAGAQGTEEQLDFSITSDLGDFLAGQVRAMIGQEVAKVQTRIESEVFGLVAEKRKEAAGKIEKEQSEVLGEWTQKTGPLQEQQKQIQALIAHIQSRLAKGAGQSLPGPFKGIFK